ncbi:MAG: hypothetical protein J6386_06880 [Candidatus Synoicihabitans palmerolidicus]|nr:hypothetical protein [Candidatus Synoicihabitans palmerolidicus]
MLKRILKDRRLWLLVLVACLVILVTRVVLTPDQSFKIVAWYGYWFMLALTLLWGRSLVRVGMGKWIRDNFSRFDGWVVMLMLVCTSVWWSHEKPGFKILADEVLLLGTSMGMHFDRSATYPSRATDVQGPLQIRDRVLDKRPLLFPFLVATVHDLSGYRPENAFYFNRGLGIAFLLLVYVLGWQAGGQRWAGVVGMLLFAGLPLAAQQSAGSGFELLNLFAIAAFALAMMSYLRKPIADRLEVLILTGLVVASCRYESIIFLVPMVAAVGIGWWRSGRIALSWPILISPLFLAVWLLQNRLFSGDSTAWQMASKEGITSPFGLEYFGSNLGHSLAFFFDFSGFQPSSAMFGALGLLALPFFGLWGLQKVRQFRTGSADDVAWVLTGAGLGSIGLLLMLYFWGQFDDRIISRLSLPVHLLMMLAIVVVARTLWKSTTGWKVLAGVVVFATLAQSLPVMAKRAYEIDYTPGLEMEIRREFLAEQPERDFLFLDNDSVFWITHLLPASSMKVSREKHEALSYHLRNHSFSAMYVFQSVLVNEQTGQRTVDPADDLGPGFELETIWERKVQTLLFARISRIVAIEHDGAVVREVVAVPTATGHFENVEQVDEQRALYLENWIKQLP